MEENIITEQVIDEATPTPPARIFVRVIDADGLFVEDAFVLEPQLTDRHVLVPCQGGFYLPRWDGQKWVEGGVAPEPTPTEPTIEDRVSATENKVATIEKIVEVLYG